MRADDGYLRCDSAHTEQGERITECGEETRESTGIHLQPPQLAFR